MDEKMLNIKIPANIHKSIKLASLKKGQTIKEYTTNIFIQALLNDGFEILPEEKAIIEEE